jgi:hypothetical protein
MVACPIQFLSPARASSCSKSGNCYDMYNNYA